LIAGCSCSSATPLSFKKNWDPTGTATFGHTETYVYDVNFTTDFAEDGFNYKQSSTVSDLVSVNFTGGLYTLTLTVCSKTDLDKNASSDLFEGLTDFEIYHLVSEFTINSHYTLRNGLTYSYQEFVKTESYSLDVNNSLAPIYSFTENKFSGLAINGEEVVVNKLHYTSETNYHKDDYTLVQKTFGWDDDITATPLAQTSNEYGYTFKSIIDNNTLLFALRNLSLEQGSAKNIPVVSGSYGSAQDLSVSFDAVQTVKVNETDYSTKRVAFGKSSTTEAGQKQLAYIQNNVTATNSALMIKMVTPIAEYGSAYANLGALVYTLRV
jgi:hypothetical protein